MSYGAVLSSIEVLILNLITVTLCLKRKYSIFKTMGVLYVFTVFFLLLWILFPAEVFSGNGQFSVLGFIYIIPLKFLYDEKIEIIFLNMCMSWTYTLGIMSVSIQAAYLLEFFNYDLSLSIIETILFLTTFVPFRKYIIPKYCHILRKTYQIQKIQFSYLKMSVYFNFFMLTIFHVIFLKSEKHLLQIAVLVLFLASNYLFYCIVYEIINSSIKINELEKSASKDILTGLGNRRQVIKDMRSQIEQNQIFSIIFLDLDGFKFINDQYGHDIGDKYLIYFGKVFSDELKDEGKLYRYAGDEFIAIYYGILTQETVNSMTKCQNWNHDAPCKFNQVSAGFVVCQPPYTDQDPNDIIKRADNMMYRNKMSKNKKFSKN